MIFKVGLTVFVITLSLGANAGASMNPAVKNRIHNYHNLKNLIMKYLKVEFWLTNPFNINNRISHNF